MVSGPRESEKRSMARWKAVPTLEVVETGTCPRDAFSPRRFLIPAILAGTKFKTIMAETANGSTWYGSASSRLGNHRQPPSASVGSSVIASWTLEEAEVMSSPDSVVGVVATEDAGVVVILLSVVEEPKNRRPRSPRGPPHILRRISMLLTNTGTDNSPAQKDLDPVSPKLLKSCLVRFCVILDKISTASGVFFLRKPRPTMAVCACISGVSLALLLAVPSDKRVKGVRMVAFVTRAIRGIEMYHGVAVSWWTFVKSHSETDRRWPVASDMPKCLLCPGA